VVTGASGPRSTAGRQRGSIPAARADSGGGRSAVKPRPSPDQQLSHPPSDMGRSAAISRRPCGKQLWAESAIEINLQLDHVCPAQPWCPAASDYALRFLDGGTNLLPTARPVGGATAPKLADDSAGRNAFSRSRALIRTDDVFRFGSQLSGPIVAINCCDRPGQLGQTARLDRDR
jgi:hypothetical protein